MPPKCRISPAEAGRRGGTVILDFADRNEAAAIALADAAVPVDRRGPGLRLSPHVWNDAGDIDAMLQVLQNSGAF